MAMHFFSAPEVALCFSGYTNDCDYANWDNKDGG